MALKIVLKDSFKKRANLKVGYILPGEIMNPKGIGMFLSPTPEFLVKRARYSARPGEVRNPYGRRGSPVQSPPKRPRRRTRLQLKIVTELREVQEACKGSALDVIQAFKEIVANPTSTDQAKIQAGLALLDRAYGKAAQTNINASVDANGKTNEINAAELDKRIREALERIETATRGKAEAPKGEEQPADVRKLN